MFFLMKAALFLSRLLALYSFIIWVRIFLSWISPYPQPGSFTYYIAKAVDPYLSLFRSIAITDRPDDVALFEAAVRADSSKANNSETVKSGNNTIAGYYQLPPASPGGENRFILFRKLSPDDATLIYLEGHTQLDRLIKLFINKKQ